PLYSGNHAGEGDSIATLGAEPGKWNHRPASERRVRGAAEEPASWLHSVLERDDPEGTRFGLHGAGWLHRDAFDPAARIRGHQRESGSVHEHRYRTSVPAMGPNCVDNLPGASGHGAL